jgi:4-amino-4-deoxy-L-arabinose transferase-like glycosyltransferase
MSSVLPAESEGAAAFSSVRDRWIALLLYIPVLFLSGLGSHGLLEPDEGRYANMAIEFLEPTHHWAEPTLSDVAHYDKPPLIYWCTGFSIQMFGANEFAMRLPSFLGSILALGGVFLLAYRQYGERAAWWAVFAGATSFQFWCLAHLLSPDMLLCGFCLLGCGLTLWGGSGAKGRLIWALGVACWCLAWWTKATAMLVPLGAITGALLLTGRWDLLARLRPLRLVGLVLLFGSPWYLLMIYRHPELIDFFLHREVVGRLVGHEDGRTGFPGYHFVVALFFWLPWWPFALHRALQNRKQWLDLPLSGRRKALPWEPVAALFVLLIFSFVSSKLITYTLPGVPLLAVYIGALLSTQTFSFRNRFGAISLLGLAVAAGFLIALPKLESSLKNNSSTRKVIATAKKQGADWIISDRYFPGMEIYAGEQVLYVEVEDIQQVHEAPGQNPASHFIKGADLQKMVKQSDESFWMVQVRKTQAEWQKKLIALNPDASPITVGSFTLWKIK